MKRAAIFSDLSLNLIDGSTIWLKNAANMVAGIDDVELTVFSRDLITDDKIVSQLSGNITVVTPEDIVALDTIK